MPWGAWFYMSEGFTHIWTSLQLRTFQPDDIPPIASPVPSSGMAKQRPWILYFPDFKSLRLTCKALGEISPFSSSRMFLSASSLNIQVFRAVADHPKFRPEIREIIWDDARFVLAPLTWESLHLSIDPELMEIDAKEGCPVWFTEECKANRYRMKHRKYCDVDRPDHIARQHKMDAQMPLKACWKYYQELWDNQTFVIGSEDDEKAFLYGLERVPRLRKVTVTPAAHGWLFAPLYGTPMIRVFPYGFNYPIPRAWHCDPDDSQIVEPLPWSEAIEDYKELCRGARIVLRLLSHAEKHNVSELSFDSKQLFTRLNFSITDRPCEEYNKLTAIMKRPGFRRIHLCLLTGSSGYWTGFQSGLFKEAISLAKELTNVHLSTTFDNGPGSLIRYPPIPLKEVLPSKEWPNLSHLTLSRFSVDTSELLDTLKLAPSSLQSRDLKCIEFPFGEMCLTGLLERMREELDWANRDQPLKPTVTIAMEGHRRWPGRYTQPEGYGTNHALFEAEYTRPNVNFQDLKKLRIIR
ncbi:hypothetical protein PEBR_01490 [Penicillium brasilianum]|uniref:F-box domain-containing protein n=1 Tax=Penicillium brasilianum TaxID=104259 RepID=A0A1S9S0E1_PENBI|nr:hypothetical protein PEBR_01490 [Penicillium brasilianum]